MYALTLLFVEQSPTLSFKIRHNFYSFALGTKQATTIHPINPAPQTTMRIGREEIKKIVETATMAAISRIMYTLLRVVTPPLAVYSRMYLPKNDCSNQACRRDEER